MAAAGMVLILTGCMYGRLAPPPGVIRVVPEEGIPAWEPVAEGVSYAHIEKRGIRPGVHLLRIALESPGVRVVVPPPFPGGLEPEEAMGRANASPKYDRFQGARRFIAVWNGTPFRYREGSAGRLMEPVGTWISGGGVSLQQSAHPRAVCSIEGMCTPGEERTGEGTGEFW